MDLDPETLYLEELWTREQQLQYLGWWITQAYGRTTPALLN